MFPLSFIFQKFKRRDTNAQWNGINTLLLSDLTPPIENIRFACLGYNNRWPSSNNPVLREIPARFTIAEKGAVVIVSPFPTIGAAAKLQRISPPGDSKSRAVITQVTGSLSKVDNINGNRDVTFRRRCCHYRHSLL